MALLNNKLFDIFSKKRDAEPEPQLPSFAPVEIDDSIVVGGGIQTYTISTLDASRTSENDAIDTWREFSRRAEVASAIQEIINEAIVANGDKYELDLVLDDIDDAILPDNVKKKIIEEHDTILKLIDFKREAQDIFRRWYVDGKQYFHLIVDTKHVKEGIKEIRWIDPKTMKKVVEIEEEKHNGVKMTKVKDTYYVYSEFTNMKRSGNFLGNKNHTNVTYKVSPESIAYSGSGVTEIDRVTGNPFSVSYLDRAVRVGNQLRLLEDSAVIATLARAPVRRAFYIDVGNMQKPKAEQYLKDVMNRFRNKVTYDSQTGRIQDQRNVMSLMEDYWLPRRDGTRGTEVGTLDSQMDFDMEPVQYFYRSLYKALMIPQSRLDDGSGFNLGRSSEITREELKFQKFISAIRNKFAAAFLEMLRTQCVCKNIVTGREFDQFASDIGFKWSMDSYWEELKNSEMWNARFALLSQAELSAGKYISREWVYKNILNMTEEDVELVKQQREEDAKEETDEEILDIFADVEEEPELRDRSQKRASVAIRGDRNRSAYSPAKKSE